MVTGMYYRESIGHGMLMTLSNFQIGQEFIFRLHVPVWTLCTLHHCDALRAKYATALRKLDVDVVIRASLNSQKRRPSANVS